MSQEFSCVRVELWCQAARDDLAAEIIAEGSHCLEGSDGKSQRERLPLGTWAAPVCPLGQGKDTVATASGAWS